MLKRSHYNHRFLPYLLVLPQIIITILFFFWPAGKAIVQAFYMSDPFGGTNHFVWFENFIAIFKSPQYLDSFLRTLVFSVAVAGVSLSLGLLMAVLVNRIKFKTVARTLMIWPYAVAPAIAGALWLFLFHPTRGYISYLLINKLHFDWNPVLNGTHAFFLVILASAWKQISYNFVFFISGLQGIPKSIIEAAAIDGAGPIKRFWKVVFPMLSPTVFYLLVMNLVFAFFETFGVIHMVTAGGPGGATNILVYKVYADGFVGLDLGSSSAQSVILMILIISLTVLQFKFVEKKVQYSQ